MTKAVLLTDHPGWRPHGRKYRRAFLTDDGTLTGTELDGQGGQPAVAIVEVHRATLPESLAIEVPELAGALRGLGTVVRVANPSLWDALATAIVRQVIRASHATALYRRFADAYGPRPDGSDVATFPSAETVLDLSDDQFRQSGMAFKRRPLRAAAEAFLKNGHRWWEFAPADLVADLQQVPRVGDWTARAAVADWSNDFGLYPYGDLAVRTWAAKAAPSYRWPDNERGFSRLWRQLAGDRLAVMTLFTLAWGVRHAATQQQPCRGRS